MSQSIDELEALAREALRTGDEVAAQSKLQLGLDQFGPEPALLHWQGLLLRSLDKRGEALALLRRARALAPEDPGIARSLAQMSLEAGLPAADLYEAALRLDPASSEARLALISAYYADGRGDMALDLLANALESNSGWLAGHRQFAQLASLLGRRDEALATLDRAMKRYPQVAELCIVASDLLLAADRYEEAAEFTAKAIARLGDCRPLSIDRATALDELGQYEAAGALFARCGEAQDSAHACRLIRHRLRTGDPRAALSLAEPWLARVDATQVWPYASLAWRMLGDSHFNWLEQQAGLVAVYDLAEDLVIPTLAARLRAIHAHSGQFADQSVKGGTQTDGPLFARIEPEIAATREVMLRALERHIAALPPADPHHPQLAPRRDRQVRFSGSWSVRLVDQGLHRAHHHPQGWFSAVLYVSLPENLRNQEGQLALGGAPSELGLTLAPLRHVEPKPGRLVVFPSTMWHATEPFEEGERMTIAFDLARPFEES